MTRADLVRRLVAARDLVLEIGTFPRETIHPLLAVPLSPHGHSLRVEPRLGGEGWAAKLLGRSLPGGTQLILWEGLAESPAHALWCLLDQFSDVPNDTLLFTDARPR